MLKNRDRRRLGMVSVNMVSINHSYKNIEMTGMRELGRA